MSRILNSEELVEINATLKDKSPHEIIKWAINYANNPVVTTNFRPYEVAILNAVHSVEPSIKVIWCDTGYNTPNTYKHANQIIELLDLNIQLYVPKQTAAHRDATLGIPQIDDPNHKLFTEQVKLEPFRRAMEEHQPDVWFTNLRKGQTAFRDSLDIVSKSKDGVLKISPFYYWSDTEMDRYMEHYDLPKNHGHFDVTKALANRECGIHFQ